MIRPFTYVKPATMEEAFDALKADNSRPLAGGTDLLVDMRGGAMKPDLLVDIKGLDELNIFSVDSGRRDVKIGARITLNLLIDNKTIRDHCPAVAEAAFSIATYQLRNRATLVGNICNSSPAADMAPPLYVLDAQVVIASPSEDYGERTLPISEFMTGVKKNALKKGEMVIRVEIPELPRGKTAFMKKQRIKGHDLALVNLAGLADAEAGKLRICIGSCASTPLLLKGTDQLFKETKNTEKLAERAADLAVHSISPIDDVRSSGEYRKDMVKVFVKRLIHRICS